MIEFAEGQEIELELPGGTFKGAILEKGKDADTWVIHVPSEGNPVRRK